MQDFTPVFKIILALAEGYPFGYFGGCKKLDDGAMSRCEVEVPPIYHELTITNHPRQVVPTIISIGKVLNYNLLEVDVEIHEQFALVGSIDTLGPKYQVFDFGEK